jgi:type VI secretion system protein ImpM
VPDPALEPALPAASGFFGKIPARGDFVRGGLPRAFTDPWDDWLQRAIEGSREILGERWLPAWMEAPIWHFALPAGQCGAAPVLGVWMPSIDAAGRHFPLTLAHVGAMPGDPDAWLAAAEAVGLAALEADLAPEEIARRLSAIAPRCGGTSFGAGEGLWWTEGSPFVPPTRLALPALPEGVTFAAMLHAMPGPGSGPDCASEQQPAGPAGAEGVRE